MAQEATVKGTLKAWFPNRLNIVIALLLLPFWLLVTLGFFSMCFHAWSYSHANYHATNLR